MASRDPLYKIALQPHLVVILEHWTRNVLQPSHAGGPQHCLRDQLDSHIACRRPVDATLVDSRVQSGEIALSKGASAIMGLIEQLCPKKMKC